MKQSLVRLFSFLPKYKFVLSSIWTLIIFYLSLFKISAPKTISVIPHIDKLVHFSMYFILCSLLLFEFQNTAKKNIIVLIMLYSVFIGVLMEILQAYIFIYRSGDFFDIIFNTLGTITSFALFRYYMKIIKK